MLILVWILGFTFTHVSAQYPPHVDFEKIADFQYKNEKYKILKPSLHIMRDYFQDYMMRRDTSDFPTKRILIDSSGFRHYWSGIEDSLLGSKNDVERRNIKTEKNTKAKNNIKKHVKSNATLQTTDHKTSNLTSNVTNTPNASVLLSKLAPGKVKNDLRSKKRLKNKKDKKKTKKNHKEKNKNAKGKKGKGKKKILRNTERTLATTTFYCPFLGLLKTQMFIDE